MAKEYALKKLYSKERIIICGCDAISGLLIHYLLDELFGRNEYIILHSFRFELEKEWEWTLDDPIPDSFIIKEWFNNREERILTTCWDWERTIEAINEAKLKDVVRLYKFCDYAYISKDLPF